MAVVVAVVLAASLARAGDWQCPDGYVAYATGQQGSPYVCLKEGQRALPKPDMACPSREQRERQKRKLRESVDRPTCEGALDARPLKPVDCYDLQSIRDFKTAALARLTNDDSQVESLARELCPLTAAMACMNPEPQCRTRVPQGNFTPWRRGWEETDVAAVAAFYRKRLPVSAAQALALAKRYQRLHPGHWTVDDSED
jgi:hypothetical protein